MKCEVPPQGSSTYRSLTVGPEGSNVPVNSRVKKATLSPGACQRWRKQKRDPSCENSTWLNQCFAFSKLPRAGGVRSASENGRISWRLPLTRFTAQSPAFEG